MRRRFWPVAGLAVLVLAASCATAGNDDSTATNEPAGFGHVHALALTDTGTLLAATHAGLYEIGDGEARRVGDGEFHDLMALAVEADGTLIASGHPDLRSDSLRVDDRPPLLGLVESPDGAPWSARSLLGEADFHALIVGAGGIIAADGTSGTLMVSSDGVEWETRGEVPAADLAVNPANDEELAAVTYEPGLAVSGDGGRTWSPLDAPPLVALEWVEPDRLVAVTGDGAVLSAAALTGPWVETATVGGVPEALLVDDQQIWVAIAGGAMVHSADGGGSWATLIEAAPAS